MRLLPVPAPRRRPLPSLRYAHSRGPRAYAPAVTSTVVFCDVRGYTALAEESPAPVVAAFVSRTLSVMARIVAAHEGRITAFTGDGVMAVFAGPGAEGGHEARALAAAVAMVSTLDGGDGGDGGYNASVGIGVATGPVAGTVVRWGPREERTVVGDAANVAQRLECQAGPGEVLVAGSTIPGAEGMQAERLGERLLRGRRAPVDVYRIVRTGSVTEGIPDGHRSRVVVAPLP